jgi:hypothetical protein
MDSKDLGESTWANHAEYKKWYRNEVKVGLREAANPKTKSIPHEVMLKKMAKERRRLKQLILAEARAKANGTDLDIAGSAGLGDGDTASSPQQPGDGDKPA